MLHIGDKVQYIGNISGDVDAENFMADFPGQIFIVKEIDLDKGEFSGLFWIENCEYGLDIQDFRIIH